MMMKKEDTSLDSKLDGKDVSEKSTVNKDTIDKLSSVLSKLDGKYPSRKASDNKDQQLDGTLPSTKATIDNDQQLDGTLPSTEDQQLDGTLPWGKANGQPSAWWVRFRERFKKLCKKKEGSSYVSDGGGSSVGGSRRSSDKDSQDEKESELEIQKLKNDIRQMIAAFENMTNFETDMSKSLKKVLPSAKLIEAIIDKNASTKSRSRDIKEIRRNILSLKCRIPSLYKQSSSVGLSIAESQKAEEIGKINEIDETGIDIYLPGLHISTKYQDPSAFEEVIDKFECLEVTEQLCLLSFAVFPENFEVKRTMLMYWWTGEGFIGDDHPEDSVTDILNKFSTQGLLEKVEDEKKLSPSSYKMEPHVHPAVIYLAKFLDLFDLYSEGKLTMHISDKEKVCLVKGSSLVKPTKKTLTNRKSLKTVFNSSERYPDFTFKWFPEMDSLKVLYLGRWERTAKRHIEVESTEFLKNMKALKNLKLASFQGISRIEKLHKSICDLGHLVILDLRACYNLEALPEDIGSLDNLIYLDVSECYMLDRMPEGIADLVKLEVLKGFVISQSDDEKNCAVKHLVKLRKLSITVNRNIFEVKNLMESLKDLKYLESLKIAWGFSEKDKGPEVSEGYREAMENQRGLAAEEQHTELKEREDGNVLKGQTSEEKKEEQQEDGVKSKMENGNEKAKLEEGKKQGEIEAKSLKSNKVTEGEKKTSPSQESTETIQKFDDQKGKGKVEEQGDGDKESVDQEQGKKRDEVEAEQGKASQEKGKKRDEVEAESSKSKENVDQEQGKTRDKVEADQGKINQEKEKKRDEVQAESSKSEEKESLPGESTEMIQNKPDDQKEKSSVEEDGEKAKADLEEGKKQEEVSKSDKVVEGEKKANPSQESSDMVEEKQDDKNKVEEEKQDDKSKEEKKGDEEKGKAGPEEGKKQEETSKSDKVIEGEKKANPSRESTGTVEEKPDDKSKGEEEKGKTDTQEGKKQNKIEAEKSKSNNGVEGVEKASNDHQTGEKQEEKGDGEKEKNNLEKGKKKDEIEEESTKPDKDTPQESKDTIQSNPDNSKVEGKEDGVKGELKTQKSDKSKKLGKKVSFSEEPKARTENKPDPRDKKMVAPTESRSKLLKGKGNETKRWRIKGKKESVTNILELPSSLKKLELECFPEPNPPVWLNPEKLDSLRKLSIKGGKLRKISGHEHSTAENKCGVEILRLKYLHEFEAEWKELQALFPKMILFEKYQCPKVAFCPTDGNGVWKSETNASPEMPKQSP